MEAISNRMPSIFWKATLLSQPPVEDEACDGVARSAKPEAGLPFLTELR